MAALVVIGMITTLIATEPEKSAAVVADHTAHSKENPLRRVLVAAYGAFSEFLTRDAALVVLAFVVFYKFCDAFAGAMTAPFVIDLGFSRNDYANIVKGVGLAATLIGGFAGGALGTAPIRWQPAFGSAPFCRWRRTSSSPGRRSWASTCGR